MKQSMVGAASAHVAGVAERDRRRSSTFLHGALIGCICLQRFGLNMGESYVFVCGPLFALLVGWLLIHGQARVNRKALLLFAVMGSCFLVTGILAIIFPDPRVGISLGSLASALGVYALVAFEPTERFDRGRALSIFMTYARLCSVLGILQYVAQFVGVQIFSFTDSLPALKPILVEHHFNFRPVIGWGLTTMRSNGFFLVEPSTFSQLLVLAMAVEFFVTRQRQFVPLYALAYALTYSGTGVLSLILAVAVFGFTSPKNMVRTVSFVGAAAGVLAVAFFAFPEIFESFASRATEFQRSGTSAYGRFVRPLLSVETFAAEARSLIGYGPGANDRSIYFDGGGGNSVIKIYTDYGIIGLCAFSAYIGSRLLPAVPSILPILCLTQFLVGGSMFLFTPWVVLASVLCVWGSRSDVRRTTPSVERASSGWKEPRRIAALE